MKEIIDNFKLGKLTEAIQQLNQKLKKKPTDLDSRGVLAELLCFDGDFVRADKQFDLVSHQSPDLAMTTSLLKLTIKGAQARADFFEFGTLPNFFEKDKTLELYLKANIDVKEGEFSSAKSSLVEAESLQIQSNIKCNDTEVSDFRDLDDLTGQYLEVIGGNGKYYWVHINEISKMDFNPPVDKLDLLWRRAELSLKNGMKGEVRVPTCYIRSNDDKSKLGKLTEWEVLEQDMVVGIGQKTFLVGEQAITIMELNRIESV